MAIGIKALDYDNPEVGESADDDPLKKYIQRAVMLCKNEKFQSYMEFRASEEGSIVGAWASRKRSAQVLYDTFLGIGSRSELAAVHNDTVRDKMDKLVTDFRVHLKRFQT